MKYFSLITFAILFLTLSCRDEAIRICGSLDVNLPGVKAELNQWLSELKSQPTEGDQTGHRKNLEFFVQRLKSECYLDASIGCYGCIYTLPALSEVIITVQSSGQIERRVLDISTPKNGVMKVVNIHY